MPKTDEVMLSRAKAMRSEQTAPEARLWYHLRAKRFHGVKFAQQIVISSFIADFVARSHMLIVELDGDTHTDQARDARRTAWLQEQGYRVIRFANTDVMANLEGVLQVLADAISGPTA
jgi:very-short-patch-repair endonuclease